MKFPSLSRGCEIAQFFVRYMTSVYDRVGPRPRNPRLKDAHTGTKRRLDDKMDHRDSGISGTGWTVRLARIH
jgi:hypothetical protein